MQVFRQIGHEDAALVGWGVRVMLLSAAGESGLVASRIAGLGGIIEAEVEQFAALSAMIDDPVGYGLFVIECDGLGGLDAGRRTFAMMAGVARPIPTILVTRECVQQMFPQDRSAPVILRAPVSAVAIRVGFEHALRDRHMWRVA